jgi:transposase
LGVSLSQLGEWLRVFRNEGLDALCKIHYRGDPGNLTAGQVDQLKTQVGTGCFRNSDQIRHWIESTFGVKYSSSGIKDLLKRIGVTYHQVSGFLWKGDPDKQHAFVKRVARHKREAKREKTRRTRRYYVDACHPVWGMDLVYYCWLLLGQRFLAGMGSGRKRLNILGAYCPDDHEYVDIRLTRDNINGEQFVNLLRLLREKHPEVECFILYVDGAKYYSKPIVKEWLARNPAFRLSQIPPYSPNVNLIERLWKFLRTEALCKWHKTFEDMQAAVSSVLDHLENHRSKLKTLMTEKFHIIDKQDIPVQYREVA